MISEFHDLSAKIDQLAALTLSLRRENAQLRQANALLGAENLAFLHKLSEAQYRLEALLASLPDPDATSEQGTAAPAHHEEAQ